MSRPLNVAIAGATGAVGQDIMQCLEQRDFPVGELRLLASARSVDRMLPFRGKDLLVQELTEQSFDGIDVALFSAGGSRSKQFAPAAVKAGAVVIDNSSAFRMDPDTPLVVPEINPEDLDKHQGIIANPNCSTIILVVPLWPLHKVNPIRRIVVSTYQAASGAGAKAMEELEQQTRDLLSGKDAHPTVFPHQIAFNLFSHNSPIVEDGYCEEEVKMVKETRKIFHDSSIRICPTTIRVPVMRAHAESVNIEFSRPMLPEEAREILASAPGVKLQDDPENNHFPMPLEASGQEDVLVGRIRKDLSDPNCLAMFICGDQLLKGAALNAVQIAEEMIKRNLFRA
ncbi:MAG: aspartate-semialdehyde dehydrogenase [Verrucomicrobiota bacterium]|mgnify:CR=1 FL=1|jgi:aspartate-semialdehyde dehydrogenase|nr:aspartate-semialdehyde dehydrogenase [Verrucomicrobiota bacterium]MDI9384191.1 aspartate-semialdehyde dehydrogenase [Verrucomicrobiota bacterium]HCF95144.1 aspartate-semialdehyde dehydrogenase [Verrucomicrobiota bacterium]